MNLGLKETGYNSILNESKGGQYAPTFRQKVTISEETGRSSCKFFGEAKRRLSDAEILDLSWRDLEFSCMSRVSSLYVNGPNWGSCAPQMLSSVVRPQRVRSRTARTKLRREVNAPSNPIRG